MDIGISTRQNAYNAQGVWVTRHWFDLFLLSLLLYVVFNKNITIEFNLNSRPSQQTMTLIAPVPMQPAEVVPTTLKHNQEGKRNPEKSVRAKKSSKKYGNLTFVLSPDYAERHQVDREIVAEKIGNCRNYVEQFARAAQLEMREYGIPASITLAQGLLESNAGDSRLSRESNNHFGIKCRTKCRSCTCRNYTDDDIYDMFRVFESASESYREHSILLNSKRYQHLLNLDKKDYKGWAKGLKKAGYATDRRYAEKLIQIIEALGLQEYDR
ncbi:MAG: hypothetical protein DHS20C18_15210 [Saprospiraceae bacterium]|nr:MAG: hypothetical protein DHS20C18_15210 [Saprospiraceae bacterium]